MISVTIPVILAFHVDKIPTTQRSASVIATFKLLRQRKASQAAVAFHSVSVYFIFLETTHILFERNSKGASASLISAGASTSKLPPTSGDKESCGRCYHIFEPPSSKWVKLRITVSRQFILPGIYSVFGFYCAQLIAINHIASSVIDFCRTPIILWHERLVASDGSISSKAFLGCKVRIKSNLHRTLSMCTIDQTRGVIWYFYPI